MTITATLLDRMGTDLTVVNAARVSFSKESLELSDKDIRLIHYLAEHGHWTPFAHPQAMFHIRAPIFVARQLGKHQVGLVWNEVSRRYVDDTPDYWMPKGSWRSRPEGSIKQGSGDQEIPLKPSSFAVMQDAVDEYERLIAEGVAPEQARAVLPQGMYTEWYWTGSLFAFSRVCKLRLDAHAQQETRAVARDISIHMSRLFPVSWNALLGVTHDSDS